MLTSLTVRGYQSLRDIHLNLAKYTVIVGPSSSGKSALTRALRLLVFGGRGTAYVSHGEKSAKILAQFADDARAPRTGTDEFGVETTRGATNQYEVFAPEIDSRNDPQVYTKLAGAVPDAVAAMINVTELCFAGQFDRPYLLDATGSEVARSLGELTEVTRIFAAVKEANRRRSGVSTTLTTRKADLAAAREAVAAFAGLPAEVKAQAALEARWAEIREQAHAVARLADALARVEMSEAVLTALGGPLAPVPSMAGVDVSAARLRRYKELLGVWIGAQKTCSAANIDIEELTTNTIPALRQELHNVLAAAGKCPTCGSEAESWQLSAVG